MASQLRGAVSGSQPEHDPSHLTCWLPLGRGTVRVFRQKFTLEDAIGSHACSLKANRRVTNGIPLGSSLFIPVDTLNCVQTLKVGAIGMAASGGSAAVSVHCSRLERGLVLLTCCWGSR
jgi:hypothetical protein